MRAQFVTGAFVGLSELSPALLFAAVLLTALAIWALGSAADWVRLKLFGLLRVRELVERLTQRVQALPRA